MLYLWGSTSDFYIVTIFINWQFLQHNVQVCFNLSLDQVHMPVLNMLLVHAIKLKFKQNVCMGAMWLSCILKENMIKASCFSNMLMYIVSLFCIISKWC